MIGIVGRKGINSFFSKSNECNKSSFLSPSNGLINSKIRLVMERKKEMGNNRGMKHKILVNHPDFKSKFKNPYLKEFFKDFKPEEGETLKQYIEKRTKEIDPDNTRTHEISQFFEKEEKEYFETLGKISFKNEKDPSITKDPNWVDSWKGRPTPYDRVYARIDDSGEPLQRLRESRKALTTAEMLRFEESTMSQEEEGEEIKNPPLSLEELRETAMRDTITEILIDQRDEEIEPHLLSLESRANMYSLHIENPEKYTINHLAVEYRARPDKVAMILLFEHHRRKMERRQRKPLREPFLDVAQDNFFDFTFDKLNDDVKEIETKVKSEEVHKLYLHLPNDLDEVEFAKQINDTINLKKALSEETEHQEHFVTHSPPTKNKFYADPVILVEGTRTPQEIERHKKKFPVGTVNFNTYEINHSPRRNDFNREIVVTELDGTVRGAYWEERVALLSKKTTGNPFYMDTVEAYLGPHYRNRPENKKQVELDDKADNDIADECMRNQNKDMHSWGGIPSLPKPGRKTKFIRQPIWWAKNSPTQQN